MKNNQSGYIDKIYRDEDGNTPTNGDGFGFAKVCVRSPKVPTIGDKFCVLGDTEVFVLEMGWMQIKDVNITHKVLQLDPDTHKASFGQVIEKHKWFMMTIVFEDNMLINDFENGLSVKVYINGSLYQSATFAAMLKQNNGNFFLFPGGSVDQCKISSFNYYNYAQGEADIQATMGQGPSSKAHTSLTSSFIQPLALSDYNIMDIYNI